MSQVRREQYWVGPPGRRRLTVVDTPATGRERGALCLAHGLTGDRVGPVELLSGLSARVCAALDIRVIRFDMLGSGDSDGDFDRTTFKGMAEDFEQVAASACPPGLPLVCGGISIGGVPAVMAASRLLEPLRRPVGVLLLSSDLIQGVRFATDGVTAIRGGEFHLPAAFFRAREQIRPRDLLLSTGLPFALVYGSADSKLAGQAPWFRDRGGQVTEIDSDHLFESTASRRSLEQAVLRFLDHVLPATPAKEVTG